MIQHIKNITILFFLLLSLSVSACSKDDFTPAYPKSEGATRLVSYNVGVFAKYAKSGYKMTARMMKSWMPLPSACKNWTVVRLVPNTFSK